MCNVLLAPGVNTIAVNKYISYHFRTSKRVARYNTCSFQRPKIFVRYNTSFFQRSQRVARYNTCSFPKIIPQLYEGRPRFSEHTAQ